ncbi:hypothetical protein R3P38DRAFT_3225398 [Favolaschia claudopus]|uniref:Uncharacterized protein n=1 Tax=Favolaschia claudopus TaxID=2862362 RepID=A0AAV9ZVM9_9AGAR
MPSTAQGNLGEVIGPLSPSTSTSTPPTPPTIPPFRRHPPLSAPKPSSKSLSRLDFITLPRRRPPLSSRAACTRFRSTVSEEKVVIFTSHHRDISHNHHPSGSRASGFRDPDLFQN